MPPLCGRFGQLQPDRNCHLIGRTAPSMRFRFFASRWETGSGDGCWLNRMTTRIVLGCILLVAIAAIVFAALAWHPSIDPISPPAAASFDPGLVRRGAQLAALGYCASCHTAEGSRAYAGGVALQTPFGVVYGTNITPDPDTGIGRWSLAAFTRAMREGIDRAGRNLYPAFPYNHFRRVTDADLSALYAFLMTRDAVRSEGPNTRLPFPYARPLVSVWNLIFLGREESRPALARDDLLAHGQYLAEGLSHCGGCHTPRNRFGAEEPNRHFDGGEAEGWWAPPLNASSPAPVSWTEESLFAYLRSWDAEHGGAVGPMARVSRELRRAPEADVRAIAHYVASQMPAGSPARSSRIERVMTRRIDTTQNPDLAAGAAIYRSVCARCHDNSGVPFTVRSLAQHTTLWGPDPRNVIRVIAGGIRPPEGEAGGIMPPFGAVLSPQQINQLLIYLRARFTDQPAWSDLEQTVRSVTGQGS